MNRVLYHGQQLSVHLVRLRLHSLRVIAARSAVAAVEMIALLIVTFARVSVAEAAAAAAVLTMGLSAGVASKLLVVAVFVVVLVALALAFVASNGKHYYVAVCIRMLKYVVLCDIML